MQFQQRTEPMELVKEHPHPFENESLNQSVHLQQLLGLAVQAQPPLPPPPSTTSSITPNLNDLTKMLSIINNATSPTSPTSLLVSPKSSLTPSSRHCAADTQSKNCLNTSNDDSLDSQSTSCNGGGGGGAGDDTSSKSRYRRRKQQKTIRMSNELNAIDHGSEPMENDDRINAMNHEHSKHDTNHSNGLNFPTFHHSDANSILTPSNSAGIRPPQSQPQTQSMDLSHHCGQNPELFENGLVNYSKTNSSLDLTHANAMDNGHCNAAKDLNTNPVAAAVAAASTANLLPSDELNALNLFGSVNFSQNLRGTHLTNDIATFPNTDDLVKKVEELVKCNEQNGFGNNDFGPMELIKSHANKLVTGAYDSTRLSNGILDPMKIPSDIEHLNNHGTGAPKHNGNGLLAEAIPPNPIVSMENKSHDNNHDRTVDTIHGSSSAKILPNGGQMDSNLNQNGGVKPAHLDEKRPSTISHGIDNVMAPEFASIGPVTDVMYEKMSEEISNNPSNLNKTFAPNPAQSNHPTSYNGGGSNDLTAEALSASSSDATPSNQPQSSSSSSTSTKASKKKTNNPTNKKNNSKNTSNRPRSNRAGNKSNTGKNSNQKNAKSKDNKSDKKSDINEKKKSKVATDESNMAASAAATTTAGALASLSSTATETLNKFRGPYVHVSRDGTLEVINAPLNEEISEKQNKFKKSLISQRPADRNKVRGLHVSTLSNKYDATTRDVSWMCVFCKLGPHKFGLGDLFGPFILSTEGEDFQLAQIDPKDDIFGRQQKLGTSASKSMPKSTATGNVS